MSVESLEDVIIIGGGLAGSTAAYHLARYGYRTLLLEKELHPHHKVCGEFLSAECLPYLQEMGIDLSDLGASSIRGLKLHSGHFSERFPLPEEGRGLSRFRLDEACLSQAKKAGAQVIRGVSIRGFERKGLQDPFRVLGAEGEFLGKTLFLASGKHEIKKIQVRVGKENSALGFKMHLQLSPQGRELVGENVSLFFYPGGYAGICGIEEGIDNLCFIFNQKKFNRSGGSFDSALNYIQEKNKQFRQVFQGSRPLQSKPLATAHVPYGYLLQKNSPQRAADGIYCLGDQFAVIPSLAGSGMALAFLTGKAAAQDFHGVQKGVPSRYEKACGKALEFRMSSAYFLHGLSRIGPLADLSVLFLKQFPQYADDFIKKTRIPTMDMSH